MGTYGLVRFAFPLFPLAAVRFAPYLALLAVIGIVYGALVAMVQPDMKKLVAEFLILLGVFRWDPRMAACAATGVILSATYMLWLFQRVNYGPVTHDENKGLRDLTRREWAVLVPIVAVAVLMGVLPNLFLR